MVLNAVRRFQLPEGVWSVVNQIFDFAVLRWPLVGSF